MGLFRSRRGSTNQASSRQPRHLLISRQLEGLATAHQWAPSVRERLLAIAGMVAAGADASAPAAEAFFNVLLEVAGDRVGREARTRLSAEPPALALDDLTLGFVDQASGPILDEEIMAVASRVLVALDPARFEIPRFTSAEDVLSRYERELKTQQRNHGFAARETGPSDFWQRQIAKQAESIRGARTTWRAAVGKAMAAGESPSTDDYAQLEAAATRDGEESLELLARRYGRAAGREVRAAALAADDGCTSWFELVHHAAQVVLGSQFEAERWQTMAAMERDRRSG
jgi:hypothetical protein